MNKNNFKQIIVEIFEKFIFFMKLYFESIFK